MSRDLHTRASEVKRPCSFVPLVSDEENKAPTLPYTWKSGSVRNQERV